MADTIELIKRHTRELDEYMKKNGKYSFHRFSDGSIHYKAPVFNDMSRIEYTCPVPIEPVKELEKLEEITKINDVLVTINDFVTFEGWDAMLGETGIEFYGLSIEIKYTGIHSLKVDYNHDLKKIIQSVKDGNFGGLVNIEGHWIDTDYLDIMEKGVTFPVAVKKGIFMTAYFSYDSIDTIRDEDGSYIYRRKQNGSNNHDLKAILKMVAKGNFGDTVFINGARTSVHDLVLLEQELMYFSCDNEPHTHGVYIKYSDVESIVDIAGYYIFGGVKK